jgi:hypothetical protein
MSFSWPFLGGVVSTRARLRFTNRGQCAVNSVRWSRIFQRTAKYLLTGCLTPGGKCNLASVTEFAALGFGQVDTISGVHIESMTSNCTCVQTATGGRLPSGRMAVFFMTSAPPRPRRLRAPDAFNKLAIQPFTVVQKLLIRAHTPSFGISCAPFCAPLGSYNFFPDEPRRDY